MSDFDLQTCELINGCYFNLLCLQQLVTQQMKSLPLPGAPLLPHTGPALLGLKPVPRININLSISTSTQLSGGLKSNATIPVNFPQSPSSQSGNLSPAIFISSAQPMPNFIVMLDRLALLGHNTHFNSPGFCTCCSLCLSPLLGPNEVKPFRILITSSLKPSLPVTPGISSYCVSPPTIVISPSLGMICLPPAGGQTQEALCHFSFWAGCRTCTAISYPISGQMSEEIFAPPNQLSWHMCTQFLGPGLGCNNEIFQIFYYNI